MFDRIIGWPRSGLEQIPFDDGPGLFGIGQYRGIQILLQVPIVPDGQEAESRLANELLIAQIGGENDLVSAQAQGFRDHHEWQKVPQRSDSCHYCFHAETLACRTG